MRLLASKAARTVHSGLSHVARATTLGSSVTRGRSGLPGGLVPQPSCTSSACWCPESQVGQRLTTQTRVRHRAARSVHHCHCGRFYELLPGIARPYYRLSRVSWSQSRISRRSEALALMALTAVSRPVVVDGDSFLDALFASAGQDRRAMEHRPQDRGSRRRTIDWQLDDRGALEARLGNVFNDLQVCNSNLICSL